MIKYQGLSTLEVLKEAKNYNKWITDEIKQYITPPTLEIGAGTGNISSHFLQKKPLYLSDIDPGLVRNLKKKFIKKNDVFVDRIDIVKLPRKKFKNFFSTIFAINVLEHIKEDKAALRNIHKMLKKKGKLLLLVPAKRGAYTKLDKDLGHFRRYEKDEVIAKLEQSGFVIEKIYYFNFVGLISWYIRDKVNRGNIHLKPYHIMIFDIIVPFLSKIETIFRPPVGISLIAVAQKTK